MANAVKKILVIIAAIPVLAFSQDTVKTIIDKSIELPEIYDWPGLDFRVIKEADSLFSIANVTELDERISSEYFKQAQQMSALCDSLWNFRAKKKRSAVDTANANRWFLQAIEYIKTAPYEAKEILKQARRYGKLDTTIIQNVISVLVPQVSKTFHNAIRYNPFQVEYRYQFAKFLQASYEKLGDFSLIDQAIEQLNKALQQKPGIVKVYLLSARLYLAKKQWQLAFESYKKAAEFIKGFAIFQVPDPSQYFERIEAVPFDTSRYVRLLYNQAECKIHLYEAQPALAILKKARKLTPDAKLKSSFKKRIEWILWDNGNIRASEIRDEANSLVGKKRFQEAKDRFISLLDTLWTERTRDEINYRIAYLDFIHLKKEGEGLARLLQVIKKTETDSATGVPTDSMHQIYFNSFGSWCFNTGAKFLQIDLTLAYLYFSQAAQIASKVKPLALIQLAILSSFDAKESIRLCREAMKYEKQLDEDALSKLYRQLYKSYRKLGNFAEAKKWYDLSAKK